MQKSMLIQGYRPSTLRQLQANLGKVRRDTSYSFLNVDVTLIQTSHTATSRYADDG